MIPFEESFFETEERCGFTVDATMKTCWAAEMEMLFEIDCICEKYNIPYTVYFGTLLGTIRHQGFIPWDDDIDIALKRKDFERLMAVLKDELPEEYVISNPITGENATEFWASIRNSSYVSIEPERLEKFHGCPFIVGIDIFQLDYIPREEAEAQEQAKLFHLVWSTVRLSKKQNKSEKDKQDMDILLDEIERVCGAKYDVHINRESDEVITAELIVLANRIAALSNEEESDDIVTFISYENRPYKRNPKYLYDEIVWLPFENIMVPAPAMWEELLPRIYKNYMVPRIHTQSHGYPLYKSQLELLRNKYESMFGKDDTV